MVRLRKVTRKDELDGELMVKIKYIITIPSKISIMNGFLEYIKYTIV